MPTLTKPARQRIAQQIRQAQARSAQAMAQALATFFSLQAHRVIQSFTFHHLSRQMNLQLKALPDPNELLPHSEYQRLQAVIIPHLSAAWLEQADLTGEMLDLPEINDSDIRLQVYLNQAGQRIVDIHEATLSAVRSTLAAGAAAGYSDYQIAHGVPKDNFRGLRAVVEETYANRAQAIARTEVAIASLSAAVDRYTEAGVREVEADDGDDDEECAERNGQTYDIDDAPELAHPNCTLVLTPVVEF